MPNGPCAGPFATIGIWDFGPLIQNPNPLLIGMRFGMRYLTDIGFMQVNRSRIWLPLQTRLLLVDHTLVQLPGFGLVSSGRTDRNRLQVHRAAPAIDTALDLELRWVSFAVPDAAHSQIRII